MKLVTIEEIQNIEREADELGLTYSKMMENAGAGLAKFVEETYLDYKRYGVLGLVGSGNNGGDTLVALIKLADYGWRTAALIVRPRKEDDRLIIQYQKCGGKLFTSDSEESIEQINHLLRGHKILLDGVLGTGIKLPIRGDIASILGYISDTLRRGNRNIVISVDCPSGVDCNSGEAAEETIPAQRTVTMGAGKVGLYKFPASSYTGQISLVEIGFDALNVESWLKINRTVIGKVDIERLLPERKPDAHKGTFGTTLIIAGSRNYCGAALLAGKAGYLAGTGLVTMAVPNSIHPIIAGQFAEATWIPLPEKNGHISDFDIRELLHDFNRITSMLIGPGFGLNSETQEFLEELFPHKEKTNGMSLRNIPVVIDADGLKLMSRIPFWESRLPTNSILTPHPGEMAVLTGETIDEIQSHRLEKAERYAQRWGHVIVLKGAYTIVAAPDGRTALIPIASAALARAGSGDVLAGLLAGFRSQGIAAYESAVLAAWIHAQAGVLIANSIGSEACVMAGNILKGIEYVMKALLLA